MADSIRALILTMLYESPARSKRLVEKVTEVEKVSEPTVYAVLKDLQKRGLVVRKYTNLRNVQYELTEAGRRLVEEEYLKAEKTLLSVLKNLQSRDRIVLELLLERVMKELPEKWRRAENKEKIRRLLKDEVDMLVKKVVRVITVLEDG